MAGRERQWQRTFAGVAAIALLALAWTAGRPQPALALDNGLALTPPMGWNGFNHYTRDVTADIAEAQARAIVASGMKDAGYTYVNLDGGWAQIERSADGELQPKPDKFPDGIKPLADYVHSLGLKFGIYIGAGTMNCARTDAGSYGHYRQDAETFARWDVDYVKFDWCTVPYENYPGMTHEQVDRMLAAQMGDAIAATGRPIVYSMSGGRGSGLWSESDDYLWAGPIANLWRAAGDIADNYASMLNCFELNAPHWPYAHPGAWNDPDMLEVGNGGMTDTEYRSHFSLWAEMAAPLLAGNDLTTMSDATRGILTNREVIAIDQDSLGRQGEPVADTDGHWVLTKPLADGDRAVVLFNQGDRPATIRTTAAAVGLGDAPAYSLRDLWRHTTTETAGTIAATVPAHGVVMYRIGRATAGLNPPQATLESSSSPAWLLPGGSTTVTATFANDGRAAATRVGLSLSAPSGWTVTPLSPSVPDAVAGGEDVTASWRVAAPPDAAPGRRTLTATAHYGWRDETVAVSASSDVAIAHPSLPAAFDNAGISDDSDVTTADFDGAGNSYSAQALAAAGLEPGAQFSHDGIGFTWPDAAPGTPDNAVARGQVIRFSGSGGRLAFVGAGSPQDEGGSGTVYYADGSTSDYTVRVGNYFNPPSVGTGNETVVRLPYINTTNAAKNGGVIGRRDHVAYVFYAAVPIDQGKQVVAVALPDSAGPPAEDGRISGMHVFALGVG